MSQSLQAHVLCPNPQNVFLNFYEDSKPHKDTLLKTIYSPISKSEQINDNFTCLSNHAERKESKKLIFII